MADETRIINGFFRDIPIAIDSGGLAGGRKSAIKQFPNRNTQTVEDLGLLPRKYSLQIIISDKSGQDYFDYRDSLLAALENGTPGELIHPFYGRIDNVVAVSYSLNERVSAFGATTVSVNFEVNENTGIPQSAGNVITEIVALNELVIEAVDQNIADDFLVSFSENFGFAVDKVEGMLDLAESATSFAGEAALTLNEFTAEINDFSSNLNSLISNPAGLATATSNLFQSVGGLYATARSTFNSYVGFFGFGEDDPDVQATTASRTQRIGNDNVINGAVAASALGYAYLNAAQIEYQTVAEVDEVAAQLDDQYAAVQADGASQEVKDAVTDLRVKTLQVLDQIRIDTRQIITVDTLPTTARLLAFNYYGDDELAETIVNLNSISDVSFIEGEVEILTE